MIIFHYHILFYSFLVMGALLIPDARFLFSYTVYSYCDIHFPVSGFLCVQLFSSSYARRFFLPKLL